MEFLSLREKDIFEESLLSILIQLTKFTNINEKNIALLDEILESMIGHKISVIKAKKIFENQLPLRESAFVLKKYLSESEKINLLIALFSIAYHKDSNFVITSSLQIIRFVDLMQIDIDIYEQLLDIIEKKSTVIILKKELFLKDKSNIFKNVISFGNSVDDDIFFKLPEGLKISFLINSNFTFKIHKKNSGRQVLTLIEDGKKYKLGETGDLEISQKELKIIFTKILHNEVKEIERFSSNKITLLSEKGKLFSCSRKNKFSQKKKKKEELAMNENIEPGITGFDILLNRFKIVNTTNDDFLIFIEPFANFVRTSETKKLKSVLLISQTKKIVEITPLKDDTKVFLSGTELKSKTPFLINTDIITFQDLSFKINNYFEVTKIDYDISELLVSDLYHEFDKGQTIGLNEINFAVKKKEFMAIMGPSGSGKTTLLKTLLGELTPNRGNIKINNFDLFKNSPFFLKMIGYVPQDDLLFSNLTVY